MSRVAPDSNLSFANLSLDDRNEEADDCLRQSYGRVMSVSGKIQDDDLRRSYLENVRENREILKEAKENGIDREGLGNVGVT